MNMVIMVQDREDKITASLSTMVSPSQVRHDLVPLHQQLPQLLAVVLSVPVPHSHRSCLPTDGTSSYSPHAGRAHQVALFALIYRTGGSLSTDGALQVGLQSEDLGVDVEQPVLLLVAPQLVLNRVQPRDELSL